MRALAFLGPTGVRLMTRNGKDKAAQFPELVLALGTLERKLKRRVVLDGEVVALERVLRSPPRGIRISESSPNGAHMIARAQKGRWEGVIAKRNTSSYMPGARSRDWLKLKLQH